MNIKYSTLQRKLKKTKTAQAEDDAFGLIIIIRNHFPIKREKVFEISGLTRTRFNAAMAKLKGKYWYVSGYLEPITNTAVL